MVMSKSGSLEKGKKGNSLSLFCVEFFSLCTFGRKSVLDLVELLLQKDAFGIREDVFFALISTKSKRSQNVFLSERRVCDD